RSPAHSSLPTHASTIPTIRRTTTATRTYITIRSQTSILPDSMTLQPHHKYLGQDRALTYMLAGSEVLLLLLEASRVARQRRTSLQCRPSGPRVASSHLVEPAGRISSSKGYRVRLRTRLGRDCSFSWHIRRHTPALELPFLMPATHL